MIRYSAVLGLRVLLVGMLLIAAMSAVGSQAHALSPNWKVLGVTGPTNLPPVSSEIQAVAVDAEGGSYTLTFESETTPALAFDAPANDVAAALNALPSIGGVGGVVEVAGGPGNAGATKPYFVQFGGALGGVDVGQMSSDPSSLVGGSGSATVSTKTNGGAAGEGALMVYATNVGGAATSGLVTLQIGPLPAGITTTATPSGGGWSCTPTGAGQVSVSCTRTASVAPGITAPSLEVPIAIGPVAEAESVIPVTVEGGGAAPAPIGGDEYMVEATVSSEPAMPGVQASWAGAFDADGQPATQAGGHPHSAGTAFLLNTILAPSGQIVPAGNVKDVAVGLPSGFIGNPLATKRCPQPALTQDGNATLCTSEAIVGAAQPAVESFNGGSPFQASGSLGNPVYNAEPAFGHPAEFAFNVLFAEQALVASLRSDEDHGATVTAPNITQTYKVYGSFLMLRGMPAAAMAPLLTNPTNCAESAQTTPLTRIVSNTWHDQSVFDDEAVAVPAVTGCEALTFTPSFGFQPSSSQAASVTAATADLVVPQDGLLDPNQLAAPHLKKSVVTLPEGVNLNPAAAAGLEACSTAQIGLKGTNFPAPNPIRFNLSPVTCPDASKIGTAEVVTPLLEEPLTGVVYLAAQDDNPFKSLLAMYLVIEDAETGITLKLPGQVKPNAANGQLTAEFDNNPQVPFEDLTLNFRGGGPRSTLATPDVCGTYTTNGSFTPWSAPESGPPAQTKDSFEITSGPGGSAACPRTKAERPFGLGFEAGSTNPVAGADSPFTLRITRPDGNQELDRITLSTPPGLIASLKGIGRCSEGQLAAAGASGRTGKQEIESPSCPASSQVGTTTIGAGVGSEPIYVKTGRVYLSGPYKGAPLSLAFVVPAVAGPFDLGVQVVRTALRINPKTAQVTAESDPIPQILKGIPLLVRDVRVDLDRSGFVRNPTNCEPMAVSGQVTGGSGAVSNVNSRFQVGNCDKLGFRPNIKLELKGKNRRAAYQKLTATVTARPGDANIARAAVTLPRSLFLAQNHIRTVCTRVQFAAKACPPGSIYGYAEAITPLLDEPLSGPVYLRSSDNTLPDLVAALRGPDSTPIEIELAGRTDSKNGGIRNTFDLVPDAPVSKFTLRLLGGQKSLIVNSRHLCKGKKKQRATVRLKGQNGMRRDFRPVVINDCKKKSRKGKGSKKSR